MSKKNKKNTTELDSGILESINSKRQERLVWIDLDKIVGWDDVPSNTSAFTESVMIHQASPVFLNYNTEQDVYEVVDGRGRTMGRSEGGSNYVLAIIYKDLTELEKATLSRIPHENRRENYIHLYHTVKIMLSEGINPTKINDKKLRMKKSLFEKIIRLDNLREEFLDGFLSNDFSFSIATSIAKLSQQLQNDLLAIYMDTGKVTGKDINKVKKAKADKDVKEIFTPELLEEVERRRSWRPQAEELLKRLAVICPEDSDMFEWVRKAPLQED